MQATQILSGQHAAIAAMLERFEDMLDEALESGALDAEALARLLTFFEEQVDGQHQEEEERIFLPRLLTRAGRGDGQQVRSLLDEHIRQRQLLIQLRADLQAAARRAPGALEALAEHGHRYLRRQRLHAAWEDTMVLPLAERVLTPRDDRAILNGFRHLEQTWGSDVEGAARRLASWLDRRGPRILA